jgi:Family of unknown function (DUF5317)
MTALIAGLGAGLLAGGRLRNLERLRIVGPWLVVVALLLQMAAFSPLGARLGHPADIVLHFASYGLLAWFVGLNRHSLGVLIAGLGLGLNLAAIAANGGFMPASRAALMTAGVLYAGESHHNSGLIGAGTHLSFLGDVFSVPSWVPAANVFSIGDVLIAVGVALLLAVTMRGLPAVTAEA